MATPTTILELATQKRDTTKTDSVAAQARLASAQLQLPAKRTQLGAVTKELADLVREVKTIRDKLAAIPTPADGPALLTKLGALVVKSRAQQARLLTERAELAEIQASLERGQAEVASFTTRLAAAETGVQTAAQSTDVRNRWRQALASKPLSSIKADANAAKASAAFNDAKSRITSSLPQELLDRARDRRKATNEALARYQSKLVEVEGEIATERESNGGQAGKSEKLHLGLLQADAAAIDLVQNATSQLDRATAILREMAQKKNSTDPKDALLTPEQKAEINNADPTLSKKRLDAAKAEADRDKAVADVQTREKELADAIQTAVDAGKDPEDEKAVKDAKANLAKAQTDLTTAENAFTQSHRDELHAWYAVVPDGAWDEIESFQVAEGILDRLAAADPAALSLALDKTEADYVKNQSLADASERLLEQLTFEKANRSALAKSISETTSDRLLGALRGDS